MRKRLVTGGVCALVLALATGGTAAAQQLTTTDDHAANVGPTVKNACAQVHKADRVACFAQVRTDIKQAELGPNDTPKGYGPADLLDAYQLKKDGGEGQTIAVTEAGDYPKVKEDLQAYRKQYGLPNSEIQVVNQEGETSPLPKAAPEWAVETALDVDMIAAIAPKAKIVVVEANDAEFEDMGKAVDTAAKLGAKFVSNSWGGAESQGQHSDSHLNHPGVAMTVASGDSGAIATWPASSTYTISVGGTTLKKDGDKYTEAAWDLTGAGCSKYSKKPAFQTDVTKCGDKKGTSDVAAVADPDTGVAVYDTFQKNGWQVVGGTSASSPIIAGIYADAGTPGAQDWPGQYIWAHTDQLNDVTQGKSVGIHCDEQKVWCEAGKGWDGPTGWGTPKGTGAFKPGA